MSELPTVVIKKANKWGYAIINEADFDPARHVRFGDEGAVDVPPAETVDPVPGEWEGLHWKQRVALAKTLTGKDAKSGAEADALIRSTLPTSED